MNCNTTHYRANSSSVPGDPTSEAWFEALEVATAPRIFPPDKVSPYCPGKSGPASIFEIDGQVGHTQSVPAKDFAVLDDAAAVSAWAAQAGLTVSPALEATLGALGGTKFVGVRMSAIAGSNLTPTLRVVMPGAPPVLPLALTRASGEDLRVTAWIIGEGRADLIGGTPVVVPGSSLSWKAAAKTSNYDEARAAALAVDPGAFLVEGASHEALSESMSIAGGAATIDDVMTTFFERAAAYGAGNFDSASCIALAAPALGSSSPVASSCPHAALGVVDPAATCTESPGPGTVDPGDLRCGAGADDLAVALSGLVPGGAWVTRQSLQIAAGSSGADWFIELASGQVVSPVLVATSVDLGGCADGGAPDGGSHTSSGPGSSSSGGSSTGTGRLVYVGGPDGVEVAGDIVDVVDAVASDTSCSCSGADVSSSPDVPESDSSCSSSSDTTGGSCGSSDGSSDSSCSSGSSGDSCGSSSGDSSCGSSSGGGESCSSGGGEGCSGGGGDFSGCSGADFHCSTSRSGRLRTPKFSILLVSALTVLVPLRRRGRRSRRPRS